MGVQRGQDQEQGDQYHGQGGDDDGREEKGFGVPMEGSVASFVPVVLVAWEEGDVGRGVGREVEVVIVIHRGGNRQRVPVNYAVGCLFFFARILFFVFSSSLPYTPQFKMGVLLHVRCCRCAI